MARKFRLTCARTTYFDVEVAAEDSAEAERLAVAAITAHPERCTRVGKPIHRVVEIVAAQDGERADGMRDHAA